MTITELGAIGELVGGVAVIGSLLYLGLQVRQSNSLARAETEMRSGISAAEFNALLASDAELSTLWHRALRDREPLQPDDRDRFSLLLSNAFFRIEAIFFNYQRGLVGKTAWAEWEELICDTLQSSPVQDWWKRERVPFSGAFRRQVEALLQRTPAEGTGKSIS